MIFLFSEINLTINNISLKTILYFSQKKKKKEISFEHVSSVYPSEQLPGQLPLKQYPQGLSHPESYQPFL